MAMCQLTEEQLKAVALIKEGHCVAVQGQAGTGKSQVIREVYREMRNKINVSVTASTGMASRQFQDGKTLHSWAGLGDGRYSNDELLSVMMKDDKKETREDIVSCQLLIIDEISMISRKVFEQVEYICRKLRDESLQFGGLQLVCVGDFFQIPPYPNDLYHDPGQHVFTSPVWKNIVTHKVILTRVMRQHDEQLMQMISELEYGAPSDETNNFLYTLSRPLGKSSKPVYLYGTNFEVDCHNTEKLNSIPGPSTVYSAEDSGDCKYLRKVLAPKTLCLKENCPVMLIRNLTPTLVNGLTGVVTKLEHDGPTVRFGDIVTKLTREPFTVYDPVESTIICERHQFPVKLAFAMTIHKSQGQTISDIVVNCRNIYQPGQLGVAVGRCVSVDGLCVLNYDPTCCKKHKEEVYEYCSAPGDDPFPDLSCCKKAYHYCLDPATDSNGDVFIGEMSDDSNFNEDDLKIIDELEQMTDTPEAKIESTPSDNYQASDVGQLLSSLESTSLFTEQQKNINNAVSFLKQQELRCVHFLNNSFKKLQQIKENVTSTSSKGDSSVNWIKFYTRCHSYFNSPEHKLACTNLFSLRPVNTWVCSSLTTIVRKDLVSEKDKKTNDKSTTNPLQPQAESEAISVSAHGKIRYVGGRSIAKCKHHYMNLVRSDIQSAGVILDLFAKIKVKILEFVIVSQADLLSSSKYPESLIDTYRKQNMSCGLTNISDSAFEFFLELEKSRLPLYSRKAVTEHHTYILEHVHSKLLSDHNLQQKWISLFHGMKLSNFCDDTRNDDKTEEVVYDLVNGSTALVDIYNEVVTSYLNVADAEFRRRLTREIIHHRSMEHRKKVLTRAASKPPSTVLSLASIQADKSNSKQASHLKLKGTLMQDESMLNTFTKKELSTLASCYDFTLNMNRRKEYMVGELTKKILSVDYMSHPSRSDSQCSDVQPGTSHSKSKEDEISDTDLLRETEMTEDVPTKKKGKGSSKSRGKSKAKHKPRKMSKSKTGETDDEMCSICGDVYGNDDNEPWIACTYCERWYHRSCGGITLADWASVSQEEAEWKCPLCS